jgi:thiamine pyrophosphokinase
MHTLILANGTPLSHDLLLRLVAEADLFIATDGAANKLMATPYSPHVVLGDFDSLVDSTRLAFEATEFIHTPDQEASDLDKAIAYARDRGSLQVTIVGYTGDRIDHVLTGVSLLMKYHRELEIRLVAESSEVRAISGRATLYGQPGDILSLVAFGPVEGVSARGVRWPLDDEALSHGSRGVSNEMTGEEAHVEVRQGTLIVCHLRR